VIVYPITSEQAAILAAFLHQHAKVQPTPDMKCLAWATDVESPEILGAVGFNNFMGGACHIHMATKPEYHFAPRDMLYRIFAHAFSDFKLKKLIGFVNSKNERSMKMTAHLGFVEEYRIPGVHDNEGDLVIFTMTPEQCKYIEEKAA